MALAEGSGDDIKKEHDKVYFTFGRFNPPHSGHAKLIRQLAEDAADTGDAYAFVTSSQDKKENPLDVYTKVEYVRRQNPGTPVKIINTTEKNCRQIKQCVQLLRTAGYAEDSIYLVVGKDQYNAGSFEFLKKLYPTMKFRTTPLLDRSDKMSATEMRKAAAAGNSATFQRGTQIGSMKAENSMELLQLVRQGLGLRRDSALRHIQGSHSPSGSAHRTNRNRSRSRSRSKNRAGPKGTGTRRR